MEEDSAGTEAMETETETEMAKECRRDGEERSELEMEVEVDEENDEWRTLRSRVCMAARDGHSRLLYLLLASHKPHALDKLLNSPVEMDGIKCTPLIAAARNGHENAVRMLLEKFPARVRLETEAMVRFEEYVIEGATALWAAAGAGHLKVVKRLAKAGAQLDHATSTASTPLRAACFDGRLDIVRYLLERGADPHIPNQYNNTCLMISAYKGYRHIVNYLLENGAKVEDKAQCGATALHFAAESGHVDIVRDLLDYGAQLVPNEYGLNALMCAAERTRAAVVEMLVERPEVTREQGIEAMELLGASFANDKEYYCLPLAYQYLRRSLEMRAGDDERPAIPRVPAEPIPAYDNWRECVTLEQLSAIRDDAAGLHMEGLTIRERILGRACPELTHPIVFRGAVFADDARFDRCLALWWHALAIRQENDVAVFKDLLRFAQVFSQMLHIGIELPFVRVIDVLNACRLELHRNAIKLSNPTAKDDIESLQEEYESNIRSTLYLMTIVATLVDAREKGAVVGKCVRSDEDVAAAKGAVYRIVKLDARIRDGQSLLHLCLNSSVPVDDFHTDDICKFPCFLTCGLLLECGADPDAQDARRDTALHYAARASGAAGGAERTVGQLVARGAHVDTVNADGRTPADLAPPGPVELLLKRVWRGRLACLAARVVSRHRLAYESLIPPHLRAFVRLHGRSP